MLEYCRFFPPLANGHTYNNFYFNIKFKFYHELVLQTVLKSLGIGFLGPG